MKKIFLSFNQRIEKWFLQKIKIELWMIFLGMILVCFLLMVFGILVLHGDRNLTKYGILGKLAHDFSSLPYRAKQLLTTGLQVKDGKLIQQNLHVLNVQTGESTGFVEHQKNQDNGYLLLPVYSPPHQSGIVILFSLETKKIIHQWIPNVKQMKKLIRKRRPDAVFSSADFFFR